MDPFLGEIKICAFPFAPAGWALCDGSLLQIQQNQALYTLLGIRYGGDGKTNFALPDLRSRTAIHRSKVLLTDFNQGNSGGAETVQLTAATIPVHSHTIQASLAHASAATVGINSDSLLAQSFLHSASSAAITGPGDNLYAPALPSSSLTPMQESVCSTVGSGTAHNNMQPSLVLNYMICTSGLYPPRD